MIVYVNGCSYASISDGKRYSEYLAEHFNCDSVNAAIPGSCNSRILRTSLRDLINLKKQHKDIVAIISLSFVLRTEVWNRDPNRQDRWKQSGDGDFISMQFTGAHDWKKKLDKGHVDWKISGTQLRNYGKSWLIWYDVESEITKLLQQIILFTAWCKSNAIKCVLFSGPLQESIDFESPFVKPFYDVVQEDTSVIDIFNKSFTEWCKLAGHTPIDKFTMQIHGNSYACGHHGAAAHRDWAKFLIENYL